jgi:hypothetical protein
MKVIIQLSGLIGRLEDTDHRQKPVQLLNGPASDVEMEDFAGG